MSLSDVFLRRRGVVVLRLFLGVIEGPWGLFNGVTARNSLFGFGAALKASQCVWNAIKTSEQRIGLPMKNYRKGCRLLGSAWRRSNSRGRFLLLSLLLVGSGCAGKVGLDDTNARPTTFQRVANKAITGVDLLLVIKNSVSMADKQRTLADAVPQLLGQLVQPNCVDAAGNSLDPPVAAVLGAVNPCPIGSTPEFKPVNNIHIGIVTSSLGDHGAGTFCTPGKPTQYTDPNTGAPIVVPPDVNDQAHLVGTLARFARTGTDSTYATLNPNGFLAWGTPDLPNPGQGDLVSATTTLTDMVSAVHDDGCGFPSELESWFRFLIDPVPPVYPLAAPDSSSQTYRVGSDDSLLGQRAKFLRPDSLVAIVMLTDKSDCSIRDADSGWVAADLITSIPTGSAACATNPNDKCCYSCSVAPPAGCAAGCPNSAPAATDDGPYQAGGTRCWNQKRRFGYDFLYPKSRYVVALTKKILCPDQTFGDMDCDCIAAKALGAPCDPGARQMPNPLYSTDVGTLNDGTQIAGYPDALPRSDNASIYLVGIVGVPWQDVGTSASGSLKLIPVTDPAWTTAGVGTQPDSPPSNGAGGIWDMIYGDDAANILPADPHMIQSLVPREGVPGPTAAANADPFVGHDYNTAREDFEYACIYPLPTARPCVCTAGSTDYVNCRYQNPNDCCDLNYPADGAGGPGADYDKPQCNGNTQVAAKAYPSLREIAVLHDYALSPDAQTQGNSVVASICPADLASVPTDPGFGYNPAVASLVDRMKERLKDQCYPMPLKINSDSSIPCKVVEVVSNDNLEMTRNITLEDCVSYCTRMGRQPTDSSIVGDVTAAMQNAKICDSTGQPACSTMCVCQLPQETGQNLATCQNANDGSENTISPGFCYVDPDRGAGSNPDLVSECPQAQRRRIRYAGNNPSGIVVIPAPGAAGRDAGPTVPLPGALVYLSCGKIVN